MRVRVLAAGFALSLLAVAPASAELNNPRASTPTTLHFHIFDTFNAFPINTQPMDVEFFEVGGTSFPTFAETPLGDFDFNTIYGFSTSGPVEYDFIENGRPRFHPERGIAADVEIDSGVEPVAYLYFEVRDFFSSERNPDLSGAGWNGLPNALPSFTVRVTMREGNDFGPDANLDAGPVVMQGEMTAHLVDTQSLGANDGLAGQTAPDGNPIFVPDEAGIVEYAIPLAVSQATIPKTDGFNVRIDWFQDPGDAAGDDQTAEGYIRLVSDAEHQPRLDLAILNPVYVEFLHPQVAAGRLLIHSGVNSPWGTYDVDVENITLTVEGPSSPTSVDRFVSQNAHVHGLHDRAAEVTWLWPFRDEDARDGDYTITIQVPNQAHTSMASATA
ncbi:MAG TPA: hypothetical protein VI796_02100, partial [Candidatus Thermoplasmatota archaeon]|nr:hypothetical protein [Candidatus Thermoplasmatota archaeon]